MANWDSQTAKAQIRLTSQRLAQIQQRIDQEAKIKRRDISSLLQSNIGLARAKAQNLVLEEVQGDLLEALEVHLGIILEHFGEVDQWSVPSPVIVEAASSIIYAAPHIQSKDLHLVRDFLVQKMGPDFARSAVGNKDGYVSMRVVQILSAPSPTADNLNQYMFNIAKTYNVDWRPEPRPQDVLNAVSQILDKDSTPFVDLPLLRSLCSQGIPNDPPCLRPRIWKLFFGIVPTQKSTWDSELKKQRESYYDLVQRLLTPFLEPAPLVNPLSTNDARLVDVSKRISRIPPNLFSALEEEPEASPLCPLDPSSPEDIRILCAGGLDSRLALINGDKQSTTETNGIPEIRLESNSQEIPAISLSTPGLTAIQGSDSNETTTTTLVSSRSYITGHAHAKHVSSLFRMLYLHQCINPGNNHYPHLPSLLIPLYSVMNQEVEPADLAHVESDTFWTFEAMVGEFSEFEDEEGGSVWMKKFRERLIWADSELFDILNLKGLDPGLPHYSYRWLAPILSQTLPVSAVIQVWDALFARPQRERDSHPKLDYLIDFCTGMLISAKPALLRFGNSHHKKPSGLWTGEDASVPELGDAFLEGMSLLQMYPVEAVGGIGRLLQTASDLSQRRELEAPKSQGDGVGFGALWKTPIWRGFTNQSATPEDSPESDENDSDSDVEDEHQEDGNETETQEKPSTAGITSYLATTVWRGITNQSAMDAPPSPSPPPSPIPPSQNLSSVTSTMPQPTSSIWNYAEKLRDSDAAASFAKVSSNWRAKGFLGGWGTRSNDIIPMNPTPNPPATAPVPALGRETQPVSSNRSSFTRPSLDEDHQSSSPTHRRIDSDSPPRPLHFKNPRDSWMVQPRKAPMSPPVSPDQTRTYQSEGGFMDKAMSLQASLASLTSRSQTSTPTPKAAPRPLLLGTSNASVVGPSRSANSTPAPYPEKAQWADVQRAKARYAAHRESLSSVSSLSPSEASSSRVVPLNRRSVSPMFGGRNGPRSSVSSSGTASDRDVLSPTGYQPFNGRNYREFIDQKEDSTVIISKPIPIVPFSVSLIDPGPVRDIKIHEIDDSLPSPPPLKKVSRKKTPPPPATEVMSDSSVARASMNRSPRLRSKRIPPKLANLQLQDGVRPGGSIAEQPRPFNDALVAPEGLDLQDTMPTPKGSGFETVENLSPSGEPQAQPRVRKTSASSRTRKISEESRRKRRSAADEGDDEGYDDLLSAYESEEGSPMVTVN